VRGTNSEWAECLQTDPQGFPSYRDFIGPVPQGENRVLFDVQLFDADRKVWAGTLRPHLNVHGTIDDYMKGLRSSEVDDQVRELHPRLCAGKGGGAYFVVDEYPPKPECTLAIDITIRHGGHNVGKASLFRFNIGAIGVYSGPPPSSVADVQWTAEHPALDFTDSGWDAVLSTNTSLAMQDYVAIAQTGQAGFWTGLQNRYWQGELTVPLPIDTKPPWPGYEFDEPTQPQQR
jgi:hypothetical protein